MRIVVANQNDFKTPHHSPANSIICRRPEAQKSKPAATTPRLVKLKLTMVSNTPNQCDESQGGRLKNFVKAWETINEDPEIIETVLDLKLDL